jgi:hypothetical protein
MKQAFPSFANSHAQPQRLTAAQSKFFAILPGTIDRPIARKLVDMVA